MEFLKQNWYWLVIIVLIIALIVVICLNIKKSNALEEKNTKNTSKQIEPTESVKVEKANDEVETNQVTEDDDDEDDEITFESNEELDEEETEEVKETEATRPKLYRISYDHEERMWLIKKDGAKRVIRKTATKAEAVEIAKRMCDNQDLNLVVHKKDGKFQKKKNI